MTPWEQEFERIDLDALPHDARVLVLTLVEAFQSEDELAEPAVSAGSAACSERAPSSARPGR